MTPQEPAVSPELAPPTTKKLGRARSPLRQVPRHQPPRAGRVPFASGHEHRCPGCNVVWTCMRRRCPRYAFEPCSEECDGVLGWPW
jgi:hypothetical protein